MELGPCQRPGNEFLECYKIAYYSIYVLLRTKSKVVSWLEKANHKPNVVTLTLPCLVCKVRGLK